MNFHTYVSARGICAAPWCMSFLPHRQGGRRLNHIHARLHKTVQYKETVCGRLVSSILKLCCKAQQRGVHSGLPHALWVRGNQQGCTSNLYSRPWVLKTVPEPSANGTAKMVTTVLKDSFVQHCLWSFLTARPAIVFIFGSLLGPVLV